MDYVYITGATGAVGLGLIKECLRRGVGVTVLVRPGSERNANLTEASENGSLEIVECDLKDLKYLTIVDGDILESGNGRIAHYGSCSAFFHLGWTGTIGPGRNDEGIQRQNVEYALDAVRLAAGLGCKAFVGAGSQAEYGRPGTEPLRPDTPCNPENAYGRAKLDACHETAALCRKLRIAQVWPRILSVYGPGDGERTMITSVIRQLLAGEKPALTAGEQMWDYLYSEDAGRALYLLGEKACDDPAISGRIYPLGSGQARPLREYIEILRYAIDPALPLGFGEIPYGPNQVMHLLADISTLTRDTGFVPETDFADGIRETIAWVKAHTSDN